MTEVSNFAERGKTSLQVSKKAEFQDFDAG